VKEKRQPARRRPGSHGRVGSKGSILIIPEFPRHPLCFGAIWLLYLLYSKASGVQPSPSEGVTAASATGIRLPDTGGVRDGNETHCGGELVGALFSIAGCSWRGVVGFDPQVFAPRMGLGGDSSKATTGICITTLLSAAALVLCPLNTLIPPHHLLRVRGAIKWVIASTPHPLPTAHIPPQWVFEQREIQSTGDGGNKPAIMTGGEG